MEIKTIKVLICDDSPDFGVKIASKLSEYQLYAYTRKNEENVILNSIFSDAPDIVIADLTLKDSDAVQIMTKARELLKKPPHFIIASDFSNSFIEQQIIEHGASHTIKKPVDTNELYNLIKLVSIKNFTTDCNDAELIVTNLIRSLGIPAHIKGYRYIRTAILLCAQNGAYLDNMTKLLYPHIAEIYDTTSERVERAIRHSIEAAWNRNNKEAMSSFFGCSVENFRNKPTNSEFIALASDKLELHMRKFNNKSNPYISKIIRDNDLTLKK
ncbi:MAG: response regulator [Ruminococcus sp.]|nr:response regulator [Ruminococcus sp.]